MLINDAWGYANERTPSSPHPVTLPGPPLQRSWARDHVWTHRMFVGAAFPQPSRTWSDLEDLVVHANQYPTGMSTSRLPKLLPDLLQKPAFPKGFKALNSVLCQKSLFRFSVASNGLHMREWHRHDRQCQYKDQFGVSCSLKQHVLCFCKHTKAV